MSDLRAAMESAGLRPGAIIADGRFHRCQTEHKPRKRNGAYLVRLDGSAVFKDYATDTSWHRWMPGLGHTVRTQFVEEVNRQVRQFERKRRKDAIAGARNYYAQARRNGLHPYLAAKGLTALGCTALRQSDGKLVVPVIFRGWLVSVQTITEDGQKRFWPGAPVKAGSFVIDRARAALTCVTEGLATGLAVFQAVPHSRVVVAFDCGNLAPAMRELRLSGPVVIAADNDHGTEHRLGTNPGVAHAQAAAAEFGCGVAYPQGILGTDWADFAKEHGTVAEMRRLITSAARVIWRPSG